VAGTAQGQATGQRGDRGAGGQDGARDLGGHSQARGLPTGLLQRQAKGGLISAAIQDQPTNLKKGYGKPLKAMRPQRSEVM
jgi:hypothetical protein